MFRVYDTNALWRHDEIIRIRHLEAEIAAFDEVIMKLRTIGLDRVEFNRFLPTLL